ncbi:CHAT domain-containing protein [Aquimarina algiphila]|uniref:CHAT domain-containing protein n=1 Tax=Aquimarina algiphila TaxID=2047982 RepID=UPI00232AD3C6|nr:CHAT domain-containing tetratricopeptide repeat protein [Aquimarina algiphila]
MKSLHSIFLTPAFFWIVLFMITCHTTYAQVEKDTIVASQYYKKADSLLTERQYDSSIEYFTKALPMYQKAKAWEKVAGCYNKISENQWRNRENLKESLSSAKKVLKMSTAILGKNNRERAVAYDNIGTYYLRMSKYQDALVNYEKSLDIEKKILPEDDEDMGATYSNLGIACRYLSKFQKAIYYQNKALSIYFKNYEPNDEKIGKEYNNIGNIYSRMGKYYTALDYYKKNLTITINHFGENHLNSGYNYFNIGIVYNDLNQYDKALEYYQKAIPIFGREENLYPLFATYNNIGTLLSDKGEFDKAMEYNKKSLNMALKIYEGDHPDIGTCYWNIGVVFENKQSYEKALQYYNKALSIYKTTYGENYEGIATLYGNIGNVYAHKNDYNKALEYHRKGLLVYGNILEKNNYEVSKAYMNIANLNLEKGAYKEAFKYSQKGLEILEEEYGGGSSSSLLALNQIATVCSKQKAHQKAIEYFDTAILANTKKDNFKSTFDPDQYYNTKFLLESFQGKAKTLQSRYLKDNNLLDLEQCNIIYKEADILINHIRQSFQNYQDKITLAKQAKEIYTDAIETQLLLYRNKQDQKSLEQAFYYAEKSKANTLKELLNTTRSKNFTGLPNDLLEIEKTLKTDRTFYQSQIINERSNKSIDSLKLSEYENKLFDINRKQDSLTKVLEKNYPKYHQLKYQNDIVTVADIQQQLDDKTTVLEFFTGDSISYAFTISKNDIAVQELATPKLTEQVEDFRKSIIDQDVKSYKKQASALYNKLINPIADQLVGDQLIIVPDGPLWHLNFDLLLAKEDDSNNPAVLSYLLKNYAITYANSANLLFAPFKTNPSSQTLQECLAFSFSDSTQSGETRAMPLATLRSAGGDLPGTREEIKAISDIIDGQYYYGSQAVEANFKKNAGQYNILHLALHGEVDNERPENSRLYFTKNKDTIEDNLLYSHELFALDIPAELTVLSACNTGTGKIAKGEGIMSLGNAFQYAGTKSLLLTNWEVSDKTTPEVMKYFYRNLKEGMNKGKALQQAKLQYIAAADINRTAPFYWGAFYLVGDAAPMHFDDHAIVYWAIGLGVLGVILFAGFWYRRRNKFN